MFGVKFFIIIISKSREYIFLQCCDFYKFTTKVFLLSMIKEPLIMRTMQVYNEVDILNHLLAKGFWKIIKFDIKGVNLIR